ncbi:MAG: undecaprenyl/decaprenyl-phosphate alpha-N-acetylglucosaminyl 1-phosphate transferase [Phycisphaerae bacterium]|nr:undecaprenyl/decaprenyl-phosphate alpha-N-acetylglucosaminyl 1-phosphate transferase [Phycisphaerae bacterium]
MLECPETTVKKGRALPVADTVRSFQWPHWLPDWILYFQQFDTYFVLFFAAAVSTAVATPIYILIARRLGWVDHPVGRKQHERATATMGGIVVFAVVFAGTYVALHLDNLVGHMLRENARYIYGLIACTTCMILLGIIDDRHAIQAKIKLLVQTVVAVGAILLGFSIKAVTLPWFGSVELHPAISLVLSLFWIVGITNAINLTDGLDGLAAGICLLASTVNAIVAIYLGNHYMTVMMVLLAGSLLAFLRWNFHPARVFLGDTGSLALGMYLALASLHSAQKAHTVVLIMIPLFALGYPIFDTLLAIARRTVRGQPLFVSDREHIHHRLMDRSRTPSFAAIQIYVASILLCTVCIAAMTAHYFVLGLGIAGVLVMALFSARVLGYLEWGGWTARWTGREDTKILHAAAHLARLKIQRAADEQQLLQALATVAPEIACRRITIECNGRVTEWTDGRASESDAQNEPAAFEMTLADGVVIRFILDKSVSLDDERRQLVEELCTMLAQRLELTDDDATG